MFLPLLTANKDLIRSLKAMGVFFFSLHEEKRNKSAIVYRRTNTPSPAFAANRQLRSSS